MKIEDTKIPKKITNMTDDELLSAYAIAIRDCVFIANFPTRKSVAKAGKWEDDLRAEIERRIGINRA